MPSADELFYSVADSEHAAYLLDPALNLVRVNTGFLRFAAENGGGDLLEAWQGRSILEAVPSVLRSFFVAGFERVRATGTPWEHDYECSSPTLYRCFRMIVYPVTGDSLFVIHSLRVEVSHTRTAHAPDAQVYQWDGFIHVCANCRRVENPHGSERWDWVPAYLERPPINVSHGLCKPCAAFYWADSAGEVRRG